MATDKQFFMELRLQELSGTTPEHKANATDVATSSEHNSSYHNGLPTNCSFSRVVHLDAGKKYRLVCFTDTEQNQLQDMAIDVNVIGYDTASIIDNNTDSDPKPGDSVTDYVVGQGSGQTA